MNVLVTGVTGFVGKHLKTRLLRDGHTVINGTRDFPLVTEFLEEPVDAIVNCAGEITEQHLMYEANVALVHRLLVFAQRAGIPRVIQVGSSSEYGLMTEPRREDARCEPNDVYSATKIAATALCQGYCATGLSVFVARPFSLYGSGDTARKLIPRLIASAKGGPAVTVGPGFHDYLHVDDFCDGLIALMQEKKTRFDIVNFGSGIETSNAELAALIPGARYDLKEQHLPVHRWIADTTRACERYGWTAKTDLVTGLRKILELS